MLNSMFILFIINCPQKTKFFHFVYLLCQSVCLPVSLSICPSVQLSICRYSLTHFKTTLLCSICLTNSMTLTSISCPPAAASYLGLKQVVFVTFIHVAFCCSFCFCCCCCCWFHWYFAASTLSTWFCHGTAATSVDIVVVIVAAVVAVVVRRVGGESFSVNC